MIKLADLTHAFGVTRNTVKLWGIEYSDYLSDSANPGHGVMREYTLHDAQVLARVYELRQAFKPKEEIHAALAAGELGTWPTFAQMAEQAEREGEDGSAPGANMQLITQLTAKASQLEGQYTAVAEERDYLRSELTTVRAAAVDAEKRAAAAEAEASILKALAEANAAPRSFWARLTGK